jgi:type IV pilus assembly protein PilV
MRGGTLIEVLVAMLIFMFGVLGLVGLQGGMTRAQTDAKFRADASYLAGELTGTIWADTVNVAKYDSTGCDAYGPCSDWKKKVAQVMPASQTIVTVVVATGSVNIVIKWSTPAGETHQYTTVATVLSAEG